jgi:hypothetical protein
MVAGLHNQIKKLKHKGLLAPEQPFFFLSKTTDEKVAQFAK